MDSATKTKLTHFQIREMANKAFGDFFIPEEIKELTDGFFNTAFMIKLSNGVKTVLKVSPLSNIKVMRYEKNIMEAEVFFANEVYSLKDVPVPNILFYDQSRDIIDSEYFFMEFIEGFSLNNIHKQLSEMQCKKIYSDAAIYAKKINSIENNYFGYFSQKDKRFDTWGKAFTCMIKEILDDSSDSGVVLPCSHQEILDIVNVNYDILNKVKIPSLVHKDLWAGNIFVDPLTTEITGLIDLERAIYGDSLLEPVCGFMLDNEEFMINFLGKSSLSYEENIRITLYQMYLYLIMIVECSFRQYPEDNSDKWPREQLEIVIAKLQKL